MENREYSEDNWGLIDVKLEKTKHSCVVLDQRNTMSESYVKEKSCKIYICGGINVRSQNECYTLDTDTYEYKQVAKMKERRVAASGYIADSKFLYIFGGYDPNLGKVVQ